MCVVNGEKALCYVDELMIVYLNDADGTIGLDRPGQIKRMRIFAGEGYKMFVCGP